MDDEKKIVHDHELDLTPVDQELNLEFIRKAEQEDAEQEFEFKLNSRRDERHLAFYLLYAIDRSDYSMTLDEAIPAFEKGFDITVPKKSLAITLVQGVLENRDELDRQLTPFLKNWRLERLGCCTRLILHLALWELSQHDTISSVVINEAIELAKAFAEKDAYRFINGILDEIAKKKVEVTQEEKVEGAQEKKTEE